MAVRYASPLGGGDGSSAASPISAPQAFGVGFTINPGDVINFLGGVYARPFAPTVSGTAAAPITYQNNAGELVHFDGSRNAADLLKRSALDPWVDVTSETGWSAASYTSQPCTGSGSAVGGTRAESGVFSKAISGTIYGVWIDAPDAGMGTANVSGAYVVPWDMSATLSGWNGYPPNPLNDIHAYDANHDLMANGYHLHEWQAQYIQKSGTLYLRTYGPDANAVNAYNPGSRKVYVATGGSYGATINGVHDIIVQDTGTDAFRIWRWYYPGRITSASNITFKKIYFAFGKNGGITVDPGCSNCTFDGCKTIAGGSLPMFNGYGFSVNGCSGIKYLNGVVAWGGQEGVTFLSCNNCDFSNNIVRNAGGHGINWKRGATSGNKCNSNTIYHCGRPSECFLDKRVGHSGIEFGHSSNGQVNYNLIYRCGSGLRLTGDSGQGACNNNDVSGNTVANCDAAAGFRLEAPYDQLATSYCSGNVGGNNIVYNNGPAAIGDSIDTGYSQICIQIYNLAANGNDGQGNRIQFTTSFHPSNGSPVLINNIGGSASNYSFANAAAAYPNVFGTQWKQRDPLFTNQASDVYTLASGSPEIDAGSTAYPRASARAYNGAAPDRGAVESGAAPPPVNPPTCSIVTTPTTPTITAGQSINFAGSVTPGSGTITSYAWNIPGGAPGNASVQNPGAVTFNSAGSFTVQFTVSDSNSKSATATKDVTVNAATPPSGTTLQNPLPAQWATASSYDASTGGGAPAGNAFDNNAATAWLKDPSAALADATPATLIYDHGRGVAGARKQFDRFDVDWYRKDARTYDYAFFVANEDQNWANVSPGPNIDGGGGLGQHRGTLNAISTHTFPLITARYTQFRIYSQSQGTTVGGVNEWSIYAKDAPPGDPGGGGGGTAYPWVSFSDTGGNANRRYGAAQLLKGKDPAQHDMLAHWMWEGALPVDLVGIYDVNKALGRLRLYPWKAAQGVQITIAIALQVTGSSFWTTVSSNIVTSVPGPTTDVTFAQQNAQKVRVTISAVNKGAQVGLWRIDGYAS